MKGFVEGGDVHFEPREMKPDPLEEKASKGHELHLSTYKDITIEEHAYRRKGDEDKQLFTYEQSLEHLTQRGYSRHLRPTEAFGLIIDCIEGTLNPALRPVHDDMLQGYSEWMSMAFERKGDVLTAYLDPVGLIWDDTKEKYVKKNFSFTEKREFDISGLPSWICLQDVNPELTLYLYGKRYEELPHEIQQRAYLFLPEEGKGRPVGRGGYGGYFYLYALNDRGASRGVRETLPPKKKGMQ